MHHGVDRWARRGNYIGALQGDIACDAFPLKGAASRFLPSEHHGQSQRKAEVLSALRQTLGSSWDWLALAFLGLQEPESTTYASDALNVTLVTAH